MNGIVNLNTRVSELLNRMGVPDYTAGYSFLHTAIMSVYEQPDLLGSIIKCLYVVVANKHKRRYCIPCITDSRHCGNS